MIYKCPNGHEVTAEGHEPPECQECALVATWFNAGAGEVYTWRDREEHEEGCRRLQDMLDDAFCNQYFPEW